MRRSLVTLAIVVCSPLAPALAGQLIPHNTPVYATSGAYLRPEDPSNIIDVSIWLNLHDRDALDALARDLYDPKSLNYRRWLNRSQIAARFGPTNAEAKTVQDFFVSHNLKVVQVGNDNFFVRARGTVADVQKAFHVQLNDYESQGKVVRANASDPYVEGPAALLVRSVAGLDSGEYQHPVIVRPSGPSAVARTVSAASAEPGFYSSNCFPGVTTQTFSTNNDGELPIGTYTGERFNLETLTSAGCGYTPSELQTAYRLKQLYAEGYTGQGQTVVIVDWCGSSTIKSDANAFSERFGLPQLNAMNFRILYTPTPSLCVSEDQVEINLDVEWAHAIAPGANIDLVVPPSASFQDVDEAVFYAVDYGLGNSISGSYASPESLTPESYLETENLIAEIAAVSGISTNFSSGDNGDYYSLLFNSDTGAPLPPTVSAPADSPWATGVGGVTLALNSDNSIAWQAGWGNNIVTLTLSGEIFDPPSSESSGLLYGSGGGPSTCARNTSDVTTGLITCLGGYPKPSFQSKLPGTVRRVPDVAWLADPFTGAVIAISVPGQEPSLTWPVVGGTSLACPMFSALWAIANQEAGAPLGQAAQYLYSMPPGAITDIVPIQGAYNVKARIQEPSGIKNYAPAQILGPEAPRTFVSALFDWPYGYESIVAISFGTDCSGLPVTSMTGTPCSSSSALHTTVGWDDVTGVGTPDAQAFADFFRQTP